MIIDVHYIYTMSYRFVAFVRALHDPRVPRGQYVSACTPYVDVKMAIRKRERNREVEFHLSQR